MASSPSPMGRWRRPGPQGVDRIAWVDQGRIQTGGMEAFLPFRSRAKELLRIDCQSLEQACREGLSGALTASGTMALCAKWGVPLAISCGIGGIGDIQAEKLCPDLPALAEIPVTLLATAFKDMLDIPASITWLRSPWGAHPGRRDGELHRLSLSGGACGVGWRFKRPTPSAKRSGLAASKPHSLRKAGSGHPPFAGGYSGREGC